MRFVIAVQAQVIMCSMIALAGDASEARIRPEASELWRRYQEEAPLLAASLESVNVRLRYRIAKTHSAEAQNAAGRGDAAQDAFPSELVLAQGLMKKIGRDSRGIESVMALNSSYAFEITKSPSGDQYAIRWLEQLNNWSAVEGALKFQRAETLAEALGYWYLFGVPFYELATNTSCHVKDVSTEMRGTRALLRVEYETQREGWNPLRNFALLDPERGFVPVETGSVYQAHRDHPEWTAEYAASIEFGEPIDGLPIPKQKTETWTSKDWLRGGAELSQTHTTIVEAVETAGFSSEEFHLSYYGLPEPHFERRWLRSFLAYLLGAASCLAAAYAIRRRRRLAAA